MTSRARTPRSSSPVSMDPTRASSRSCGAGSDSGSGTGLTAAGTSLGTDADLDVGSGSDVSSSSGSAWGTLSRLPPKPLPRRRFLAGTVAALLRSDLGDPLHDLVGQAPVCLGQVRVVAGLPHHRPVEGSVFGADPLRDVRLERRERA